MSSSKISKNVEELQNLKNLVNNNVMEIIHDQGFVKGINIKYGSN